MPKDNNGWDEYKKLILYSLDDLKSEIASLKAQHETMRKEFELLVQEYKYTMGKIKVYLTLGVALAGAVVEIIFLAANRFFGQL